MITDETEIPALRKDGGLILQGAVIEVINEVASDPIPASDFAEVSDGNVMPVERTQYQKPVRQSFLVTDS